MPGSSTRFRLVARDGSPLADGAFTYVIPERVAAGARAYAVEMVPALFARPETIGTVTVQPVVAVSPTTPAVLSVSGLAWSVGADGTLHASGIVRNDTEEGVGSPFVALVFLDGSDRPLAILYDVVDVRGLAPGASTRFDTSYPTSLPVKKSAVAKVETFAYDLGSPSDSG